MPPGMCITVIVEVASKHLSTSGREPFQLVNFKRLGSVRSVGGKGTCQIGVWNALGNEYMSAATAGTDSKDNRPYGVRECEMTI